MNFEDRVALVTEYSSYYTGQSLVLNGGLTAQRPFLRPEGISAPMRQSMGNSH
jgi:hypothetical protein